jgi:hypothetical protein
VEWIHAEIQVLAALRHILHAPDPPSWDDAAFSVTSTAFHPARELRLWSGAHLPLQQEPAPFGDAPIVSHQARSFFYSRER